MSVVWCDRRGVIGISRRAPRNMLPLAKSSQEALQRAVEGCARLAYDNETWLVPGIPEADTDNDAVDAAIRFQLELKRRLDRPTPAGAAA